MIYTVDLTQEEVDSLAHASGTLHAISISDPQINDGCDDIGIPTPRTLSKTLWDVLSKLNNAQGESEAAWPGEAIEEFVKNAYH